MSYIKPSEHSALSDSKDLSESDESRNVEEGRSDLSYAEIASKRLSGGEKSGLIGFTKRNVTNVECVDTSDEANKDPTITESVSPLIPAEPFWTMLRPL